MLWIEVAGTRVEVMVAVSGDAFSLCVHNACLVKHLPLYGQEDMEKILKDLLRYKMSNPEPKYKLTEEIHF